MPTLVNNLRAIRGPVTAVPVTAGSGIEIAADTQNNQIVISANLEAGSGIEIVDDNGKAKIINSDNAQALPIVAGAGVKLSVVNNQVVVSADETYYSGYNATSGGVFKAKANADIITDVRACRIGNLVMINGLINPMAKITIPSTTWTYIGTVNDELKPSTAVYFPFTCVETQLTGGMKIGTDGKLSINQASTSNGFGRYFSVAYSRGA